MHYFDNGELPT